MIWGRINNDVLVEFINFDPTGRYHPDVEWVPVPEYLEPVAGVVPMAVMDGIAQPISVDNLLEVLLSWVATRRYAVETGGIRTDAGAVIRSDREDQAMLNGAVTRVTRKPDDPIDFKTASGWIKIGKDQVYALADIVGEHVQICFSREEAIDVALRAAREIGDAARIMATYQAEIDAGWPANALALQKATASASEAATATQTSEAGGTTTETTSTAGAGGA